MAITINGAAVIAMAVKQGVKLGNLVTVGRQGMYAPKADVNDLLRQAGRPSGYVLPSGDPGYPVQGDWADDLYLHFGATKLNILDGSPYEGADLIHDLNQKIPPAFENRFDCLIDGGSLEHIFNVPEALASYMKMVRVGGHVILLDMPITNLAGHGFYQFSPALFWQVFSRIYGFEVVEMVICECAPFASFWHVANPAELKHRVELVHDKPCHLNVVARKIENFNGFVPMPVQDDYTQAWSGGQAPAARAAGNRDWRSLVKTLGARWFPREYWKLTNRRNHARTLVDKTLGGAGAQNPYSSRPNATSK